MSVGFYIFFLPGDCREILPVFLFCVFINKKRMGKTVKINGTDYKVKKTVRSIFIFEQITGKRFDLETLQDSYIFFYSVVLANNPDNVLQWDDFIDALDRDPEIFTRINDILKEGEEIEVLLSDESEEGDNDKKKA